MALQGFFEVCNVALLTTGVSRAARHERLHSFVHGTAIRLPLTTSSDELCLGVVCRGGLAAGAGSRAIVGFSAKSAEDLKVRDAGRSWTKGVSFGKGRKNSKKFA